MKLPNGTGHMAGYELPTIEPAQIHVWRISLHVESATEQRYWSWLEPSEHRRAERFLFAQHRMRFVVGRATLRCVLGHYVGVPPAEVAIRYWEHGKPYLDPSQNPLRLAFNLSNSHAMAVLALAVDCPLLGIDIEYLRRPRDFCGLAARFFAPEESAELFARGDVERLYAFFQLWTRKEAYLKAVGQGLTFPLNQVVVTQGRDTPPRIVSIQGNPREAETWQLRDIELGTDYLGSMAYCGKPREVLIHDWPTATAMSGA